MSTVIAKLRSITTGALLLCSTSLSMAADTSHPGYLDFETLPFLTGKVPKVEVNLHGPVLKMLAQLPIQYDESNQAAELLRVLEQVLVRVYNTPAADIPDTLAYIEETSTRLQSQEWVRIVKVREEGNSNVDIHVRMSDDGENLYGLVVMAVEGDGDEAETVFVNIAGNFNPAYLANLGSQFDIGYLEDHDVNGDAQ